MPVNVSCALARAVSDRLIQSATILSQLEAGESLSKTESKRLQDLRWLSEKGLEYVKSRRPKGFADLEALAQDFVGTGCAALFSPGPQRGGDFLQNQLRGRWAEQVVLAMPIDGLKLFAFGPTGAAMPGEEDYVSIRRNFDTISRLEGKRPDLIGFRTDDWESLDADQRLRIERWQTQPLEADDAELIRRAAVGIEVKNSTWHYARRRAAGGGALSITVKQEELEILSRWSQELGVSIIFIQTFFDEAYVMSFKRMREVIAGGERQSHEDYCIDDDYKLDRQSGAKEYHHIYTGLVDQKYRCADVTYPDQSEGVVQTLADGNVIPYIKFAPSEATNVRSEVVLREIKY